MYKKDVQKVTNYDGGDKEIRAAANRIEDMLFAIPADADLGAMESVCSFESHGAFDNYDERESSFDAQHSADVKQGILHDLESIRLELASWIKNNPVVVKYNVLTSGKKESGKRRKFLAVVLGLIAAVAIVLTILQYTTTLLGKAPVGEIIGLVDLVLGISGFVYEIVDDGKRDDICAAVQDMSESESAEELKKGADKLSEARNTTIVEIKGDHNVYSKRGGKVIDKRKIIYNNPSNKGAKQDEKR